MAFATLPSRSAVYLLPWNLGGLGLFQSTEYNRRAAMHLLDWVITAMLLVWFWSSEILTLWTVTLGMCSWPLCHVYYNPPQEATSRCSSQQSQLSPTFESNQPIYQTCEWRSFQMISGLSYLILSSPRAQTLWVRHKLSLLYLIWIPDKYNQ